MNHSFESSRFLSLNDLTHLPPPQWLVKDFFEVGSLVQIAGPPGSFKSFLALDWMLCMASGRNWLGKMTVPSKCLYCLGEGKSNLLKRVRAWDQYNHLAPEEKARLLDAFRVTFDVPQMAHKSSVDNMLAGLADSGFTPNVMVLDTYARSAVGLEENSNREAGLWVDQADRLRSMGWTIIVIHHTAKNTESGMKARGASAIDGALETQLFLSKPGGLKDRVTLQMKKQKDHDEVDDIEFQRLVINPDDGSEGSIVLTLAPKLDERFTEEGRKLEDTLRDLINTPFPSDRARGRELEKLAGLSESAAQSRISRYRIEHDLPLRKEEPKIIELSQLPGILSLEDITEQEPYTV